MSDHWDYIGGNDCATGCRRHGVTLVRSQEMAKLLARESSQREIRGWGRVIRTDCVRVKFYGESSVPLHSTMGLVSYRTRLLSSRLSGNAASRIGSDLEPELSSPQSISSVTFDRKVALGPGPRRGWTERVALPYPT